MSLQFKLIDIDDYLRCEVHGRHGDSPQASIDYFLEVLLHCRSSAAPKVLIDLREVEGTLSATSRILFYEKIIDKYEIYLKFGGLPIRMVFLLSPQNVVDYNPGLNVAMRRNFPVSIHADLQEAIDWLKVTERERETEDNSAILEFGNF